MRPIRSARLLCPSLNRLRDWKLSLQIRLARIIEIDPGHKIGPIPLVQGIYHLPQFCNLLLESALPDVNRHGPFAKNKGNSAFAPPAFVMAVPASQLFELSIADRSSLICSRLRAAIGSPLMGLESQSPVMRGSVPFPSASRIREHIPSRSICIFCRRT